MTLPVHVVDDLAGVTVGATVAVTGDEAHHAVAVRRLAVGERVVLTDGSGRSVTGPVSSTAKRAFDLVVEELDDAPRPEPRVTVVQALPKGDRGELAVEVLTEVGVDVVVPWAASRSVAVWRGERAAKSHAKWSSTAREAAKQARRVWHPEVTALSSTSDVVARIEAADVALVLHEDAMSALSAVELPERGEVLVVVGPEGGVAPEELEAFAAAGAVTVRLGREVLRTSTAGVVAVGALLSRTRRWST
ncbi:16S rRNA (uracil(1498)-N(3))-methyltransferase [Nocardioides daphniae]|uniref:Ribosomal RNA small subunit methyltransferase E n=1 Tax=Nocardioides daphniae TaxID=402297 RepID=A0A4V1CWL2_9ACTN|nr:16S rRNA (uracil(1498)-N(3))-methyltransferase [Nocardioides daphniae]QCC77657.1 16S rRNA (uracil(1498)-N(3))-methyltransferase [Nocardioides daphniae]GGD29756.1 ribosomal RNA small subunit methyltransferase E [Nocardioides daphniae]